MERAVKNLDPITLQEMESVKLMNRVDTKFLASVSTVLELLERASHFFLIQEIDGQRIMPYYSRYFDTPDNAMYYDHQRGKKSRRKVRIREYVGSGLPPFLEIKDKNNRGRTKKHRISMEAGDIILNYPEFIQKFCEFSPNTLLPKIENRFNRITLVNKEKTERITIDTSVEFNNFVSLNHLEIPKLAIIEWKRDSLAADSALKPLLRQLHIHESGFSKYCIGMALTDPLLHQNRLKKRLRLINKIIS